MSTVPEEGTARAQLTSWVVSALPVIAGGIGFAGFVSLLGAGILWIRFDAAELPAGQALAKFPRADLISTGAVTLALFLALGLLAVLLVYLLQSMVGTQAGARNRADLLGELEDQLTSARGRRAALDSDLAPTGGAATGGVAATALASLRAEADEQVAALERELIATEVQSRQAEKQARGEDVATPTLANQVGLLIIVVVEVVVVIWASHANAFEKIAFSGVIMLAAIGYTVLGEATDAGKAHPNSLFIGVDNDRPKALRTLILQVALVVVPLVFAGLLIDKWLVIPIVVALLLAAGNLAIGRLYPRRFFWYGCSIFVSVTLFGAVLTYSRTRRDPSMQPAAAALNNGKTVAGFYITETGDRLYLAHTETKSHSSDAKKDSGSIFWLSLKSIRTIAIGPLQPIAQARRQSEALASGLKNIP